MIVYIYFADLLLIEQVEWLGEIYRLMNRSAIFT